MSMKMKFSKQLLVFNLVFLFLFVHLGSAVVVEDSVVGSVAFAQQKKAKKALKKAKKAIRGVKGLAQNVEALESQVEVLETEINTNASEITTNAATLTTQGTNISNNVSAIAAQETNISNNVTAIAAQETNITANVTAIAAQETAVTSNTTANATQDINITNNVSAIATQETYINNNITAIATQETNVNANVTAIATNLISIASLQNELTTIELLPGPKGDKGDIGNTGPKGDAGVPGISGKDDADGVEVTFIRESVFDPGTGPVPVLDVNGTALFINQANPSITLGGQVRNVLFIGDIPNTNPVLQQVVFGLPDPIFAGQHKLKLANAQGDSELFTTIANTIDGSSPVITLSGSNPVNVILGTTYVDAGSTALDAVDGDLTANIVVSGLPPSPTTAIQTYTVTYNVVDNAGNSAVPVIRTVNVVQGVDFNITAHGNAQLKTDQKKFGTSSVFFDGNSSYLSIADDADWQFGGGTGPFTLDFWFRSSSLDGTQTFFAQFLANGNYNVLFRNLLFHSRGLSNTSTIATQTFNNNTWYHIALVRDTVAEKMRYFINGNQIAELGYPNTNVINDFNAPMTIGAFFGGFGHYLRGHMDEFRLSDTARWTSNFSPPTSAYSVDGSTQRLIHFDGPNGSTVIGDSAAN